MQLGPPLMENSRFYPGNVERLQDFLLQYGRLPINESWDSLGIGTLQGTLYSSQTKILENSRKS